jgi:long-chain acyl-CoA synthetase
MIPQQIISFFQEKKIRDVLAVPLFYKALKKGIELQIQSSKAKKIWFETTFKLASKIPSKKFRRALFLPIHKKFGGELRQMISGASALDPSIDVFFETLGISIFEGYGMTETAPVISANSRYGKKSGSIGKILPGLEVKLHPVTQEILVRGPNVMLGYYNNEAATRACLSEDGWLNTGDVGQLDRQGFLSIKGRNKDIIVLGSGKKVAPDEIESYFQDIVGLQDICALGVEATQGPNQGTEIAALVVVPAPTNTQSKEEIEAVLHKISQKLSYYKRPSQFIILDEALPKTSTLKIQRNRVRELLIQKRIGI